MTTPHKYTLADVAGLCLDVEPRCDTCGAPMALVGHALVEIGGLVWVGRVRRCDVADCPATATRVTVQRPARDIRRGETEGGPWLPSVAPLGWDKRVKHKIKSTLVRMAVELCEL
jgi:hypothetical protein